ncbi:MAG: hypothetical protein L6R39_001304 [Caloplaca ligustica]|nr:MAG: hypothetical protein L6R39_001304 [Caloplaca ligustica]
MPRSKISLLLSLLLASHSTFAQRFTPRGDIEQRYGTRLEKRLTCEPARPDVSEDAVFTDACNENPQNSFTDCFNTLYVFQLAVRQLLMRPSVLYAQDSATETCAHFYTLYNDCLVSNHYSETACADSRAGYVYCSNYTTQAYAYCGCYFALPEQLYNCATVELQVGGRQNFDPAPTSTLLTSAILTGPIAPSSATLSSIPQSAGSSNAAPVFSPRQSSTLLTTTAFVTSTIVTTWCGGSNSECATTTHLSTFASESSTLALVAPSSSPAIATGTPIALSTAASATTPRVCGSAGCSGSPSSPTPTAASMEGHQQSTSTLITTVLVTRTSTVTSCPATITPCQSGYSSEVVYTTSTVSTILSCEGGCDAGPSKVGECVVRKRVKAVEGREL